MLKGKYVEELAPGSSFTQSIFVARNAEIKVGKNGSSYAMFNVEDRTGSAAAKFWNISPEQEKVLLSHSFFLMNGSVDNGQYSGQVTVSQLKPVNESDIDADDFLPALGDDHQFHCDRFIRLVKSVRNPHLKSLLRGIFGSPADAYGRFKCAVAAKSMHHSHRGGLLEHSAEVAEMCDRLCDVFPHVNRDLVVTCALIHDIGKLEEMDHGIKHGEYTADGALLGHIVIGTQIILSAMGPDFPPILKRLVLHLILSHHGKGEFGSPKDPATQEAFILASCDLLSAKMNQGRQAISNARPGQVNVKIGDFYMYVGDYGVGAGDTASPPASKEALLNFEVDCARLPIAGSNETKDVALPEKGADYLVRVSDNSMDASGILPGDLVFIKCGEAAGELALVSAAADDGTEIVRRLEEGNRLVADGPGFPALQESDKIKITGSVTGLLREL